MTYICYFVRMPLDVVNLYMFWLIIETKHVYCLLILEQDVINCTNFMKYLTKEDQQQLLKLLSPMDSLTSLERFILCLLRVLLLQIEAILFKLSFVSCSFYSLKSMFNSIQFADAIHNYQRLLGEGILDPSFPSSKEWNTVKRLALTNL